MNSDCYFSIYHSQLDLLYNTNYDLNTSILEMYFLEVFNNNLFCQFILIRSGS